MFDIPRCIVTIAFIIGSFLILMPRRTQRLRRSRALLSLADLLEHRGGFPECVIAHRHAAIDRLLQDDLLEVVGGEGALDQRRAHVMRNSSHLPIAIMVPMTRMRRVRSSKCGRVHTSPQAQRVMKSCHSAVKAVLLVSARSTQASPRILRRASAPLW